MNGKLILFPVPIGAEDIQYSLPNHNCEMLNKCHTFIVEELRTARRFLKKAGYSYPIDSTTFFTLNEHTDCREVDRYLDAIENGENIGLLSEAGLPCVADPGALITKIAQQRNIEIIPLIGPSSIMLSLMASGFNGQNFAFVGYLPIEKTKRQQAIRNLETRAYKELQTQIFIEAPYRNNQMLESLLGTCRPETMIGIGCDLTLPTQTIRSMNVKEWKCTKIDLHKRNTVFLLYGNH